MVAYNASTTLFVWQVLQKVVIIMAGCRRRSCYMLAGTVLVLLSTLPLSSALGEGGAMAAYKCRNLTYYLQQEFGTNELGMVAAARPPVNGTFTGFGQEIVYEFVMTATADPASDVMGYVRGTAIAVSNTAAATVFFVSNVVHYEYEGVTGTLSQQGEAIFTDPSWEFSVVGGTGAFRDAFGYNLGGPVSISHTPAGPSHVVTHYEAHFSLGR